MTLLLLTWLVTVSSLLLSVLWFLRPRSHHRPEQELRLRSMTTGTGPIDAPSRPLIDAVERRGDDLLGPLTPVDCNAFTRYCLVSANCKILCKDAAVVEFDCKEARCLEREPGGGNDGGGSSGEGKCDAKNGEYAVLVGYSELGVAQWQCVQMYPAWQVKSRYCEKGTLDIDARKREPSYRDCTCPLGTYRVVYKRTVLGQSVYGLPHCVPTELYKFYSLDYDRL